MVAHLLCKQGVRGSSPLGSTIVAGSKPAPRDAGASVLRSPDSEQRGRARTLAAYAAGTRCAFSPQVLPPRTGSPILFPDMRNLTIQETRMVGDAIARVVALLPVEWSFAEARESPAAVAGVDVVVELVGPSGNAVRFAAEVRRSGSIPTSLLITVLRDIASRTRMPVLYVSDYIGRALREGLAAEGISYADTTGWVRIVSADPLILLTGAGSPRAPRDRRTNAVVRLNGLAANRLIRALATVQPPVGVRSLAVLAGVSPGSVCITTVISCPRRE